MAGTRPAFFVAVLLLATPATLNAAPTVDEKFPPDIERLLTLPEDQIDIGEAALIFARQAFPGKVDVTAYSRELDRLADEARQLVPSNAGSDEKVIALIDVIYKREGYRYDFSPGAWSKNANYFLPGILDTKQGACVNMPMLFMAVAQRLGLQIYPAHTPQHTFLRNTDPFAQYTNIEATGGGTKTDAHYIEEMHISQTAIDKGTYMRTLTHHEYLADLLVYNGQIFSHHHAYLEALKYFKKAEEINPNDDFALMNLMDTYLNIANHVRATSKPYLSEASRYHNRLLELGVDPHDYGEDPLGFNPVNDKPSKEVPHEQISASQ